MSRSAFAFGVTSLLSLSVLSLVNPAQAAVLNGGFETNNFSGWSTLGSTSIQTAAFGSSPTAGTYQALLETVSSSNYAALEQFLGLTVGSLDGLGYGETFGGSAIKQTFTANAGDTLSFDWNFLTNEDSSSANNDFAFVIALASSGLADTNSVFLPSSTMFGRETGFQKFSSTISASGSYTLGIGIINVADGEVQSGLLVDNVSTTPISTTAVPTPALLPGMLTALGLGVLRKKFNSKEPS